MAASIQLPRHSIPGRLYEARFLTEDFFAKNEQPIHKGSVR